MTLPVSVPSEDVVIGVYGDLVFLRAGRAAGVLTFLDHPSPFPRDEGEHLAHPVVATGLERGLG